MIFEKPVGLQAKQSCFVKLWCSTLQWAIGDTDMKMQRINNGGEIQSN
jgi:hypothetical protein